MQKSKGTEPGYNSTNYVLQQGSLQSAIGNKKKKTSHSPIKDNIIWDTNSCELLGGRILCAMQYCSLIKCWKWDQNMALQHVRKNAIGSKLLLIYY